MKVSRSVGWVTKNQLPLLMGHKSPGLQTSCVPGSWIPKVCPSPEFEKLCKKRHSLFTWVGNVHSCPCESPHSAEIPTRSSYDFRISHTCHGKWNLIYCPVNQDLGGSESQISSSSQLLCIFTQSSCRPVNSQGKHNKLAYVFGLHIWRFLNSRRKNMRNTWGLAWRWPRCGPDTHPPLFVYIINPIWPIYSTHTRASIA